MCRRAILPFMAECESFRRRPAVASFWNFFFPYFFRPMAAASAGDSPLLTSARKRPPLPNRGLAMLHSYLSAGRFVRADVRVARSRFLDRLRDALVGASNIRGCWVTGVFVSALNFYSHEATYRNRQSAVKPN